MTRADKIKAEMMTELNKIPPPQPDDYLSTGITTLNLAFTGNPERGYVKGLFYLYVGDSSAGKTWVGLSGLAEAANNPAFDGYQLIHDNTEHTQLPPIRKYFGNKLDERLCAPRYINGEPVYSSTVEEFADNVINATKKGPVIYVEDSFDALTTEDELSHFEKKRRARTTKEKTSGTYGTSKAKENSAKLRIICNALAETKSILIGVSQTRQAIGFNARFDPKTRSGGNALTFYNRMETWLSLKGHITADNIRGKTRRIGRVIRARIKKNHLRGWEGDVTFPIYRSVGIDDIGGCIDFLVEEGHWTEKLKVIQATEFEVGLKREALVSFIEASERERDLRKIVHKVWKDIEKACAIQRKKRYE